MVGPAAPADLLLLLDRRIIVRVSGPKTKPKRRTRPRHHRKKVVVVLRNKRLTRIVVPIGCGGLVVQVAVVLAGRAFGAARNWNTRKQKKNVKDIKSVVDYFIHHDDTHIESSVCACKNSSFSLLIVFLSCGRRCIGAAGRGQRERKEGRKKKKKEKPFSPLFFLS